MKHPVYSLYGLLLLGLVSWAEYRGFSLARINEVRDVPKTVRDNPGVYRSHYRGSPYIFRGK